MDTTQLPEESGSVRSEPVTTAEVVEWPARHSRAELESVLEQHRVELTAYCNRMLSSPYEAEDAVQESFFRAWRGYATYEGRATLRSWLYRIATNVCFEMLNKRRRSAPPMDLGPSEADAAAARTDPMHPLVEPNAAAASGDPAESAELNETVRAAFVTALQRLPARQRAVLILRDVLSWKAGEAAELLGTSIQSVNSALQRARSSLRDGAVKNAPPPEMDDLQQELLARYVDAFERYDMDSLLRTLVTSDR